MIFDEGHLFDDEERGANYELLISSIISELKTLRKKLCKFKNCDKNVMMERLENSRSDFFTVHNEYCNLSRFLGYQPDGMERSGMESG